MRVEFKGSCLKLDKASFILSNLVNLFIVYELDRWSQELNTDSTLKFCLFGAVELTKNCDSDKQSYPEYGIRFHSHLRFSVPNFDWYKNVVISGVYNSSSVHIDNNKKNILVVG